MQPSRDRFGDATVVVLGTDNVLGRACAQRFAEEGARVLAVGPEADPAPYDGDLAIEVAVADLGDQAAIRSAAKALDAPVDALVNAHLAIDWASIEDGALERWQAIAQVNMFGPFIGTQAFLPLLKRRTESSIVNVSSVDGIFGNPFVPSYSTSKGGVLTFTHVAAHELAKYGIRVNCIARAMLDDSASTGATDDYVAPIIAATPLKRCARAAEVAAVVAFLASPDASFVSGETIVVDGGRTAYTPYTGGG